MSSLYWIGLAAALIAIEAAVSWKLRRPFYDGRDTEVGLGLTLGWLLTAGATTALAMAVISFGYVHRITEAGKLPLAIVLVVVLADFLYYAWHRMSHHLRWLWATHRVHHTAGRMNILASFRQGWTDVISGTWLTWAPLGFLGFAPEQAAVYFTALLIWEAFIHNEWTPRLGPLEWVLVTPSNHRIHHSLETAHWNRNFGGIFIVWDRLFGTYAAEGKAPLRRFGLADHDAEAHGPLAVALHEWRAMYDDVRKSWWSRGESNP